MNVLFTSIIQWKIHFPIFQLPEFNSVSIWRHTNIATTKLHCTQKSQISVLQCQISEKLITLPLAGKYLVLYSAATGCYIIASKYAHFQDTCSIVTYFKWAFILKYMQISFWGFPEKSSYRHQYFTHASQICMNLQKETIQARHCKSTANPLVQIRNRPATESILCIYKTTTALCEVGASPKDDNYNTFG